MTPPKIPAWAVALALLGLAVMGYSLWAPFHYGAPRPGFTIPMPTTNYR